MNYQAVLFDLDGTLLDTIDDLADSMNAALERLGCPGHGVDEYRLFVGDGVDTFARRVLPEDRQDEPIVARCVELLQAEYANRWNVKTRPYDGVAEMLNGLAARGLAMAVLSNKPDDSTKLCVANLLPDWRFDMVQGVADGFTPKPDPAGALKIAETIGIAPGEFLYLGDTNTDMQTATAAGMYPVGATWGFRPADELSANGAKTLINHPTDLLKLI
ncbi:MAG: HAD family hydrolase [Phycisphaerae bacterium]|nr:HAD family hydrolase [Phycisphaerae bacterium]